MTENLPEIVVFFKKNINPGKTLQHLSLALQNQPWPNADQIHEVTSIEGEMPVKWNSEHSVFVFRFQPDRLGSYALAIYLRMAGKIDRANFINLIRNKNTDSNINDIIILEIGFSELLPNTSSIEN